MSSEDVAKELGKIAERLREIRGDHWIASLMLALFELEQHTRSVQFLFDAKGHQ